MEPPAGKYCGGITGRNLVVRLLVLGVLLMMLRFFYVVTVRGESCDFGDFCFFSSPETVSIARKGVKTTGGGAKLFLRGGDVSAEGNLEWSSAEWRKAVSFYSDVFQTLMVEGFLSSGSKALCIGSQAGHEVFALKEIGVHDAVGIGKKKSPPSIVSGNLLRQPFENHTFDFVFLGAEIVDSSKSLRSLANEVVRTLKSGEFLVVHTSSCGDLYSLNSFILLFSSSCRFVQSRELDTVDGSSTIREIVLQKVEEGSHVSSSGGKVGGRCSIPDHKLKLVKSAEPLITTEPLKPWITLKKNAQNIKYLPSMVDISFKSKYVYIDVGARSYGSSIGSWFRKKYPKQNRTFDVYAIEADKAFHAEYSKKKGIKLMPFAAWVRNETLSFEVNHNSKDSDSEGKGLGMGRIRQSSESILSSRHVDTIQGFDFAEWLKNTVTESDFVVMKMDVEGTEFDLIPRLFETGAICLVDELFLECHYNRWQRCCPGKRSPKYQKTYDQCLDLLSSLRQSGVLVHQWW